MVDWKAIPKIDAHIHLLPDDVIEANRGYGDPFVEYGCVVDYLQLMQENHIEAAFVMPFNDPNMLSMDGNIHTVHANMQHMATMAEGKIRCFADVDIKQDIGQTLDVLKVAAAQRAFVGIKLHPSNAGYPIDGQYYDHILRYASEQDILVEIHSYPRAHLPDDLCAPGRIKNVLRRYPALRVSIAHLGGFQHEALYGVNAYVNISAVLPDLAKRLGIRETNAVLRRIGVERLVFATDYPDSRCLQPHEIYGKYFELLGQMDFTQNEAQQICKHNALRMLTHNW
ncbi:MAG: amidohydrolase family protein [Clostridia bacterium]|nr:amidohydrolase family protein [Clostridia bacterium]